MPTSVIIVITGTLLLAVFGALYIWADRRERVLLLPPPVGPAYELSKTRDDLSLQAIGMAAELGVALNYERDSIDAVERVLSALHDFHRRNDALDDDSVAGTALAFGAYLIKTLENTGVVGVWQRNHPEEGENAFGYIVGDVSLFPVSWCYKRLAEGPGDDVRVKFAVAMREYEAAREA